MSKLKKSQKQMTVDLVLQGGGSLGAEQAGKIATLLSHPEMRIRKISGVSAGLLNGAVMKQIFSRYGQNPDSARAVIAMHKDMWLDRIAVSNSASQTTQTLATVSETMDSMVSAADSFSRVAPWLGLMARMHPATMAHEMAKSQGRYHYGEAVRNLIDEFIFDEEALNIGNSVELYGEMVNANTNQGRLIMPGDHTAQTTLASMSLEGVFNPQIIDGDPYIDGAYAGGSNAPYTPILDSDDEPADMVWVFAANEPDVPFQDVDIKSLTREDLADSKGLLLSQGLWPFVQAIRDRENGVKGIPPIHLHFRHNGVIHGAKDKLDNSCGHLTKIYPQGKNDLAATFKTHGAKLTTTPLVSSEQFIEMAERNSHTRQAQQQLAVA